MHPNPVPRRQHSAEFKAQVVACCNEPGASIASVALSHSLNANLVRKWHMGRGMKRAGITAPVTVKTSAGMATPPSAAALLSADARFLPIELAAPGPAARAQCVARTDATPAGLDPIHIELRRGAVHLSVRWPTSAAGDCTAWLRELSLGLLK
jgi:transposase